MSDFDALWAQLSAIGSAVLLVLAFGGAPAVVGFWVFGIEAISMTLLAVAFMVRDTRKFNRAHAAAIARWVAEGREDRAAAN